MHNKVNFKNWTNLAREISISGTLEGTFIGIYIHISWYLNVAVSTLNSNNRVHVNGVLYF